MGCGCGGGGGCRKDARTCAAICHVCAFAEHAPRAWVDGAMACTISGRPITEHLGGAACPRGYHPTCKSLVARLPWPGLAWVEWYGVPWPIRVALWSFHPRHPARGGWPGCGCLVAVKAWFRAARGWVASF